MSLDTMQRPTPVFGAPKRGPRRAPVRTAPETVGPIQPKAWGATTRQRALILANLVSAAFYVAWWASPGHVGHPLLFTLLGVAEAFNLAHLLGLWWAVWSTRFVPPPAITKTYTIDVFVTTLGEPLDVLRGTIAGAVAMRDPSPVPAADGEQRVRVWVLDDAGRDEVRELARSLGAGYIRRGTGRGAKAGNLNTALNLTEGELIAVFDADHVPRPDFLERVTGYLEEEGVAFVQTPQYYANARRDGVARDAFQQQAIFYGPICRGKNGIGAAFCCGTNVLFRRRALEDVGGFDERSIVEDFVTSMRLHRRGWTSVYYPYVLAEGMGPETLRSYFRQQFRWARGSIGALMSGEPFRRGFSLGQRVQYLLATTFYLIGFVTAIYVALPILFLTTGLSAFSPESGTFVFYYAPYLTLGLLTIRRALGGQLRLEHLRSTFGAFPVYLMAGLAALIHLPARFRVTDKSTSGRVRPPVLAAVSVLAFGATAAAIVVGAIRYPIDAKSVTNMSWAAINLVLLSGVVRLAIAEARSGVVVRVPESAVRLVEPSRARTPMLPEWSVPSVPRTGETIVAPRRSFAMQVALWTAAGFVLRLALVGAQSLRLDESLSLEQARMPLMDLWTYLVSSNVHVPLYHTILHGWVAVAGGSEWAIRIPSVVFGAAALPLLFAVARRLVGRRAALWATAFGALSPFWAWHSNEARMYPVVLFMTLASMALLFRAVERGTWARWLLYAVVTGLSFYSHYFALLMPPVHLAYLLIHRAGRRQVLAWVGSMAGAFLVFAPWIVALYTLRIQVSGFGSLTNGIRPPTMDYTIFGVVYSMLAFFTVYIAGYHSASLLAAISGFGAGLWPLAALGAAVSRGYAWIRSRATVFLASWLVLTIGAVFLVNIAKPGLFFQKYLISASPAILIGLAALAARVLRGRRIVAVALALVLGLLVVSQNLEKSNPVREDFRAAARIVAARMEPGDVVVALPKFNGTPLEYYLDARVHSLLSPEMPPEVTIAVSIPEVAREAAGGSLWIVMLYERAFDADGAVPLHLDRTFLRTERYRLGPELEVRRYRIPEGWTG